MAIQHQTTVKSWFEAGDRPTQAQFADWIETSMPEWSVNAIQLVCAGATGPIVVISNASATVGGGSGIGAGVVGNQILGATTTASAFSVFNPGAVGTQIFQAVTTASVVNFIADDLNIPDAWADIRDFGAVTAAVCTTAINSAIATGRWVYIPPGTWPTAGNHTGLKSGQAVFGRRNLSRLMHTNATNDLFVLNAVNGGGFFDFDVWASGKTAGYVFHTTDCQHLTWGGVRFGSLSDYTNDGHRLHGGILCDGFFRHDMRRDVVCITSSRGMLIHGGDFGGAEFHINGHFINQTSAAIEVGGNAGGVYFDGEISQATVGFKLNDNRVEGTINREIFFGPQAIIDSCADYGLFCQSSGAALIDINGSWFSSAGRVVAGQGVGVYIDVGGSPLLRWTGGRLYNNSTAGMNISGGANILLSGLMIHANGTGVDVPTATPVVHIVGCKFFNNSTRDLFLEDASLTSFQISDNDFTGTVTVVPTLGSSKRVYHNRGSFITESGGVATQSSGTTVVQVAHGLSVSPAAYHINVLQISSDGAAAEFFVSGVSAAAFNINTNVDPTVSVSYAWNARVGFI